MVSTCTLILLNHKRPMKKNKNQYNQVEKDILQIKLDMAHEQINALKESKSTNKFVLNTVMKERDRAQLATKYLTHLFLVMDSLDKILYDDYPLGWIVRDAIINFKTKLNSGMLDIKYDGQNLWFDGNNNNEMNDNDEEA